jgi:hypothetical protein
MQLTDEQKNAVSQWVKSGASLSDVQKRLAAEFSLVLTYIDVRFLLIDLGLDLVQPKEERKATPTPPPLPGQAPDDDDLPALEPPPPLGAGNVSVDIDRIMRPGTMVSGTVVFSDGAKANWAIDQTGRLALMPAIKDYRPAPEDIQAFQKAIQSQLQKMGYG